MKHLIIFVITLSALSIAFFGCGSTQLKSGGRDVTASVRCSSDSNCSIGQICDLMSGVCVSGSNHNNNNVDSGSECTSIYDCGAGQYCEMHEGIPETHTCLAKKANGASCYYPDNQGNDCIASTPSNKVCDPSDQKCGIRYNEEYVYDCVSHEQCRDYTATEKQYCEIDPLISGANKCYLQKGNGSVCKHDYQCKTWHCDPGLFHDKCANP